VSWRIRLNQAAADLERLDDEDRASMSAELMEWVEAGPPRINRRDVAGAELFEDNLRSGFEVVYMVDESVPYAAILRVRCRHR
jgi:hypothetical protein